MIKENKVDPRVKLMIVLSISTLGIIIKDIIYLFYLLLITFLIAKLFGVKLKDSIKKLKNLVFIFIGIVIMQSIFMKDGNNIITVKGINLLNKYGIEKGFEFIFRIMIIIFSATILGTSNSREIVQGFVQMGMPYELAFMVATGIRFLPIMTEEIKDSIVAIKLRGVELEELPFKERLNIYSYIFIPIVLGTISKAKKLSTSIEMRGFRAYDSRTSYMELYMTKTDYLIALFSLIGFIFFLAHYLY